MQAVLPPAFLSEKSGTKELDFIFFYEFVRLRLCRTNGQGVYILFSLVGKKDQKSTRRVCAPSRLPWNAVKLRLRFASQVLRRYWKFQIFIRRKKHIFYFFLSDIELTQAKFYIIFEFLLMNFSFPP